jgi:hypothetical protein
MVHSRAGCRPARPVFGREERVDVALFWAFPEGEDAMIGEGRVVVFVVRMEPGVMEGED